MSSTFRDSLDREWTISINVGTLAAVKKETGLLLADAIKPGSQVIETILNDPSVFFDVLVVLLRKQLKEREIDEESFAEGLDDEEVAINAAKSVIEGIIDFFPKDRSRPMRRALDRLWSATRTKVETETRAAIQRIENIDYETAAEEIVENATDDLKRSMSSVSVGSSQDSSESIRPNEHSESSSG